MKILSVISNAVPCFSPKLDKKAKTYRSEVDKVLDEFQVKEKVFLFITDNENTMKKAFGCQEKSGCFPHIVSKACKHALEDQECLSNLRQKLRDIVSKANRSPKLKNALIKEQRIRGLKPLTLVQEVETRFTATKLMFGSFLNDSNRLTDLEIDEPSARLNIEAVNAALADPEVGLRDAEDLEITSDMLSEFQKHEYPPHKLRPTKKLTPNLLDKTRYIVHSSNLKYYLEQGMELTKVHRVLTFKQSPWLREYVEFNSAQRSRATSDFEKSFFKLMNNSVFGELLLVLPRALPGMPPSVTPLCRCPQRSHIFHVSLQARPRRILEIECESTL